MLLLTMVIKNVIVKDVIVKDVIRNVITNCVSNYNYQKWRYMSFIYQITNCLQLGIQCASR
jgi:hypothetical protein